jgi:hypothetical protein
VDSVNERSRYFTRVSFTDENGDPVTPMTAEYKIDDIDSGLEVRGWTDITTLAEQVDVPWETTDTEILDETKPHELRRMTWRWTYMSPTSPPAESDGTGEYLLVIKNLKGITSTSPA